MILEVYVNGELIVSKKSIRFLSAISGDNKDEILGRRNLTVGGTSDRDHLFTGRIYDLVITGKAFDREEVRGMYSRQSRIVNAIKKSAAVSMCTNSGSDFCGCLLQQGGITCSSPCSFRNRSA